MIILRKIVTYSSRAKIILELFKKQSLGHGLQSSTLLQSTFTVLAPQVAVEDADNFSDVSINDERDPNWTGGTTYQTHSSPAMKRKSIKWLQKNKLRTTRR